MNFKKICSLALSALIVASSSLCAFAANTVPKGTTPTGWTTWLGGNAKADRDVYNIVNDNAYSGSSSLCVNNVGVLNNEQYYLSPTIKSGLGTGQYKISLKISSLPYRTLGSVFLLRDANGKEIRKLDLMWSYDTKLNVTATELDNGWYELSWLCDATSAAPNSLWISIYASSKTYYIDDISLTLADGTENFINNGSFEAYPRENTIAPGTIPYGYKMWYGGNASAAKNRNPFEVVNSTSYSGQMSLRFNNTGVLNNEQHYLAPNLKTATQTGQYKISLKISSLPYNSLGSIFLLRDANGSTLRELDLMWCYDTKFNVTATALDNGWYELSWLCDAATAPQSLWIKFYASTKTFYIDDISISPVGSSENLVQNGNFDEIDPSVPIDLTGIAAKSGNGKVSLSWDTPIYGYGARIYDITNGENNLLASAVFPERNAEISGLENGKTYTLCVKSYSNYNIESSGVTITATPFLPDWELGPITSSFGGTEYISGSTTFSSTLTNNKLDNLSAVMLAALYDANGKLLDVSSGEKLNLSISENSSISASLNVPADFSSTYIKVFAFNSTGNITPIAAAQKFNPATEYISKRTLSQNELLSLVSNKSNVTVDSEGYMDIERFTPEQKSYLESIGMSSPTNVRLAEISFTTNSSVIEFDYNMSGTKVGYISTYIDGELSSESDATQFDGYGTYTQKLDGNSHRVTIYLPQQGMTIKDFKIASAAEIQPITGRTRAMFYGDSITQGIGIYKAADCYVNTLARLMDYEVLNYGVSGYVFDPKQIKESSYFEPEIIYVAYGTNDATAKTDFETNFEPKVRQFITNLRELYPQTPITLITPIWTNWADRIANLDAARSIITTVAAEFENVSVINGLELIPAESKYFGDDLHPNTLGAAAYAKNLSLKIK